MLELITGSFTLFWFSLIVFFLCYISTIIQLPVLLLLFSILFLIVALKSYYSEDKLKFLCIGLFSYSQAAILLICSIMLIFPLS